MGGRAVTAPSWGRCVSCCVQRGPPFLHQSHSIQKSTCMDFFPRPASWTPIWCWISCVATGFLKASGSVARASPTAWSSRSSGRGEWRAFSGGATSLFTLSWGPLCHAPREEGLLFCCLNASYHVGFRSQSLWGPGAVCSN